MEESGTRRLKTKEDGAMGSQILQNSSDPDATYREKEGKQNRGYTANIVETVESMEKTEEPTVLITTLLKWKFELQLTRKVIVHCNIPRGVFFANKVHRKPENCGAKRVTVNGNHEKDFREL